MTPEQIEAAAGKLCELRGLTPEEQMRFGVVDWNASPLAVVPITHLQHCVEEIRAHLQVQEAIASVIARSPKFTQPNDTCAKCGRELPEHVTVVEGKQVRLECPTTSSTIPRTCACGCDFFFHRVLDGEIFCAYCGACHDYREMQAGAILKA